MTKARDHHFAEFDAHTRLKHLIWDRYLKAWAQKLLGWGGAGQRLWIIDAFAGSGADSAGNPGSPRIAATIARDITRARREIASASGAIVHVIAMEKDIGRAEELRANMAEFLEGDPPVAYVWHGTLADVVDRLTKTIGTEPALFFLDPFGVDGMQAELLPKILAGPHNEIFALFSDTGAARLHAVLGAEDVSADDAVAREMREPSLFAEYDAEEEAKIRARAERRTKALGSTRSAAIRILNTAFGGDWWLQEIERVEPEDRPFHFVQLYVRLLHGAGAVFTIPIPVRDEANRRVYHLVYASKSAKGFRAMKESIATALNASALPAHVLGEMVLDLHADTGHTADQIARHFAGREVRWTDSKDKRAVTVRNFVLEHTGVFPYQCDAVRDALRARYGTGRSPRSPVFTFPPAEASAPPSYGAG